MSLGLGYSQGFAPHQAGKGGQESRPATRGDLQVLGEQHLEGSFVANRR